MGTRGQRDRTASIVGEPGSQPGPAGPPTVLELKRVYCSDNTNAVLLACWIGFWYQEQRARDKYLTPYHQYI